MPDVLDKTRIWTPEHLVATGRQAYFRPVSGWYGGTEVLFEGRRLIMTASHDYLGLSADPRVREAAAEAVLRFGTSLGGSRIVNGSLELHEQLEARLAAFLGHEAALVLPSGFQANLTLAPLMDQDTAVFTDFANHASLNEAVQLGSPVKHTFLHGNMTHLERRLTEADSRLAKLILTDGVFSVDGDVCNLPALTELARAHGARIVLDSSHDLGMLGASGAGAAEHFGHPADLVTSALSKSLASVGGVIAGPAHVIRYLRHNAPAAIFTAAAAPANVAASLTALDILQTEPHRRTRLLDLAEHLHNGLRALGFDTGTSTTPIVSVKVSGQERCFRTWRRLCEAGVFTGPITHPGVPRGREVLRITLTAAHTDDHLERVLAALEVVGRKEGIIPDSPPGTHTPVAITRPPATAA